MQATREVLRLGHKLLVSMPIVAQDARQLADVPQAARQGDLARVVVSAMAQHTEAASH